ncbi:nucleotidyltransferase substrate binding protein [Thiocapsa sp. UBA6158]|jgi:nucleotidyltransferase substrate binding protein (TIGR01987 family)|uniref:nucleotidyltransferase substrate binding protein n=1 Tax=Thiocapsa sp. UBA6158 TaxID=1947692 RepID=UPI0025F2AD21|nr:nucleotidyltransferase substrate binding protein [Thiocapsa sp. UBA6158]
MLDISALEKVIARLAEGIARYQQAITDTQIRDGLIQRFEFTYELSHKMLKRDLVSVSPSPDTDQSRALQDLIRSGNAQGRLQCDWPTWRRYSEMRGMTSHTYDEDTALAVVDAIPSFLAEATYLRDRLKERGT